MTAEERIKKAIEILDSVENGNIDSKNLYDLRLHLSEAIFRVKELTIYNVSDTLQILKDMNFVYPDTKLQRGGDYGDDACIELIDVVGFEIDTEKDPLRQRIYL